MALGRHYRGTDHGYPYKQTQQLLALQTNEKNLQILCQLGYVLGLGL